MLNLITNWISLNNKNKLKSPNQKILLTLFTLFLFRFGNSIPLSGIDQGALKKAFLQFESQNSIMQIINMYSGGGTGNAIITPFSLGIIPYINASILVDLLTALLPFLEKLQSEEGEAGRQKLTSYKKILTVLFSFGQSLFLISYLRPYFYNTEITALAITVIELVTGSLSIVWLSSIIDSKGIGNGTSVIIFTNIVVTLIGKNFFNLKDLNITYIVEVVCLLVFIGLICISQTARINIDVVSARQLAFLENSEKKEILEKSDNETDIKVKENGLSIKLNQAGIFPIIIASNLIPFISYILNNTIGQKKLAESIFYYVLIIGFNYFYTIVFWDPEKISEQLRKASVSIVNVTPGQETVSYLENVVRSTSILGGIFLCLVLFSYDFIKQRINGYLLNQINISSLIILIGVAYELQKTIRAIYKNLLEDIK